MKNTEGRTDADVTDPNEIREIAELYVPRSKGVRGFGFAEIEAIPRFNLRQSKGMNAYRIVKKFREMANGDQPAQIRKKRIQPVSAVPEVDEDKRAIVVARRSADKAPVQCWETYWMEAGLPEPKANIPSMAPIPELTEQQLAEQAASREALARLNGAKKRSVRTQVSPEDRAWGTGWRAGFYKTCESCPYADHLLARLWNRGLSSGQESRVAYMVAEGTLPDLGKPVQTPAGKELGSAARQPAELAVAS